MRVETERKIKRWREQRWLLDQIIQTSGIDWDQGRTGKILRNCGPAVKNELQEIAGRIKKYVDIPREFACAAESRAERGREAEEDELMGEIPGEKLLYVFEGERHSIKNPCSRPLVSSWLIDTLMEKPFKSEIICVETSGREVHRDW